MRTLGLWVGLLAACERASVLPSDASFERRSRSAEPAGERPPIRVGSPALGLQPAPLASAAEPSLAVLAEALASEAYESRMIAVEAIGEARLSELTPWLEKALGDPEHDVRMLTVEALGKLGTPAARAALISVRDDTTEKLDIRALAAAQLLRRTRP